MSECDYRAIDSRDEETQLARISATTFNFPERHWHTFTERVGSDNLRVMTEGGRVRGGLGFYTSGQWYGGRCLPMAGIALVCTAPEARSQGVARALLRETLRELRDRQFLLATLFASTQLPYRKVGFEQAGSRQIQEVGLGSVSVTRPTLDVHLVDALTPSRFQALASRRARRTNGNLERTDGLWQRLFDARDNATSVSGYLIGDLGEPQGYLIFYQEPTDDPPWQRIVIHDLLAETPAAAATLWRFLHSHRALVRRVCWAGPTIDPLLFWPQECQPRIVRQQRWMTRLLNLPAALMARGYAEELSCSLELEVDDGLFPQNAGRWVLQLFNGQASVERGGRGAVRLDARGLASLFTGFCDAESLYVAGRLDADSSSRQLASTVFRGPEPWMADAF